MVIICVYDFINDDLVCLLFIRFTLWIPAWYEFLPVERALNSIRKQFVTPCIHATIVWMCPPCQDGHYHRSKSSQLSKSVDDSPPSVACIVCFCIMKPPQCEGNSCISSNLISPCSVTKVCGTFSNMVFQKFLKRNYNILYCFVWFCVLADQQLERKYFVCDTGYWVWFLHVG